MQRLGNIKITDFALKHFDPKFGGTKILDVEPKDFEQHLNTFKNLYFDNPGDEHRFIDKKSGHVRVNILEGYAPFCKLLVMANITQCKTGTLPIALDNIQYKRSGYFARRSEELPVLTEWIDIPYKHLIPRAKYTVSVLYSKEQIDKEAMAMYKEAMESEDVETFGMERPEPFGADYGVVAILGQMSPKEESMKPITMMRNFMPIELGGSGIGTPPVKPGHFDFDSEESYEMALNEYKESLAKHKETIRKFNETYAKSIEFWKYNATVK